MQDFVEEIKESVVSYGKQKPHINEVKQRLNGLHGNEEWFRFWYANNKEYLILRLTKFVTGKRKLSTQNRLNSMSLNELVDYALKMEFIR